MEKFYQYLIAVTAAALICGIAKNISSEKTVSGAMLRLIAGVVMTITVLSPVVNLELDALPELACSLADQSQMAVSAGQEMAATEMNAVITQQVQAYILDKAAMYGAALQVEVLMPKDGTYQPEGIILYGCISPYGKTQMESIIAEELQISKENQQWIG